LNDISRSVITAIAAAALLSLQSPIASAATYTESGDAGQTLATAQSINTFPAGTTLTNVFGVLGNSEADVYRLYLRGGKTFSATTAGSLDLLRNNFDMQLFLFSATGIGVYANDDDPNNPPQSVLPASISFTPMAAGLYYLAIAGANFNPVSSGGRIFPPIDYFTPPPDCTTCPDDILGPTGPGGGSPLTGWIGASNQSGSYDIILTGAEFESQVPEPSYTILILVFAIGCMLSKQRGLVSRSILTVAIPIAGLLFFQRALSAQTIPANLGGGLRELVQVNQQFGGLLNFSGAIVQGNLGSGQIEATRSLDSYLVVDGSNRVLVDMYLDGTTSIAAVQNSIAAAGGVITGIVPNYRNGFVSAYIPVVAASSIATSQGIRSIFLAHKPVTNATASQAVPVHRADLVHTAGINGSGITVGVLSDSYNASPLGSVSIRAADDVASGDLPNDPAGPGLKYLVEAPIPNPNTLTDEGRGMAQLVYDMAPGSRLCFATANGGQATFANNIRDLRTNPACNADVIVDDVFYFAEPMFSDGVIAAAVEDVVNSSLLPGKKVSYFSSAGNQARLGYASDFRFVPKATAVGLPGQPVNLNTIPAAQLASYDGFHNFDPSGGTTIAQTVTLGSGSSGYDFQWDDPFGDGTKITSDYDLLLFFGGTFLFGSIDNNATTAAAFEFLGVTNSGASANVQLVVARKAVPAAHTANRIKYVVVQGSYAADFNPNLRTVPVTFGHSAANSAISVAAYEYDNLPPAPFNAFLEAFSSPGPTTIAFDADGNRLSSVEVRKKPDIAAADRMNTTFFIPGVDYEPDGKPNFSGTSAAAPNAAGIAALMLQKAGGPGTLNGQQVKTILQTTAPARDYDRYFSKAVATGGGATVTLTATGDTLVDAANTFWRVTCACPGQTLTNLTINLANANFGAGMVFSGAVSPGASNGPIVNPASSASATLSLSFTGFGDGGSITFGIDRNYAIAGVATAAGRGNKTADVLAGATITATLSGAGNVNGSFVNLIGKGYSIYDGYGFVDAKAAVDRIP
jgi:hypothetical protein